MERERTGAREKQESKSPAASVRVSTVADLAGRMAGDSDGQSSTVGRGGGRERRLQRTVMEREWAEKQGGRKRLEANAQ